MADAQVKTQQQAAVTEKPASVPNPSSPIKLVMESPKDDEKENNSNRIPTTTRTTMTNNDSSRLLNAEGNNLNGSRPLVLPPTSPDAIITLPLRKPKSDEGRVFL